MTRTISTPMPIELISRIQNRRREKSVVFSVTCVNRSSATSQSSIPNTASSATSAFLSRLAMAIGTNRSRETNPGAKTREGVVALGIAPRRERRAIADRSRVPDRARTHR